MPLYGLTGVLCTVGDEEVILASDPTRGSRHDFPPVGQEGHCFFSYLEVAVRYLKMNYLLLSFFVCFASSYGRSHNRQHNCSRNHLGK